MTLGAVQFCDAEEGVNIFRILGGNTLKNFQRRVRLIAAEQIFRQTTLCIQVIRLQVQRILIGGNGELGAVPD